MLGERVDGSAAKSLRIYLQEVTVSTYTQKMSDESVSRVDDLSKIVPKDSCEGCLLQKELHSRECLAQAMVMMDDGEDGLLLMQTYATAFLENKPAGMKEMSASSCLRKNDLWNELTLKLPVPKRIPPLHTILGLLLMQTYATAFHREQTSRYERNERKFLNTTKHSEELWRI